MNPLAKKFVLILYVITVGPLFVNYLLGFGWFRGYDGAVILLVVAVAYWIGNLLKARAENKAQSGELVVEALDAAGAVHSDPKTDRFVLQAIVIVIVIAVSVLICLGMAYRVRSQRPLVQNAVVLLVIVVIATWVLRERFGNISQVESDDGVTLTLRQREETTRLSWSQVESVEVSRPYAFWQVTLKIRPLVDSKVIAVRFLPLGWRKMTPAVAEKLKFALEARRIARQHVDSVL